MKKYKKILTSLICTAVTAASVCSLFIADAASNLNKTYRYYFDVIAGSGVSSMDAQFRYNFNKTDVKKVYIGNLGGTHGFSVLDTGIDISYNKTPAPSSAGPTQSLKSVCGRLHRICLPWQVHLPRSDTCASYSLYCFAICSSWHTNLYRQPA